MRNILLTGSPGTGKTFLARAIAYYLCVEGLTMSDIFEKDIYIDTKKIEKFIESERCEFVQVHPAMCYEDIVYGIDVKAHGSLVVSSKEQRIKRLCDKANGKSDLYCVIFDDVSRVDIGTLLGDLLYAMDYRDQPIELIDGQMLTVPHNVLFIFTECSEVYGHKLDYALRRRMDYVKELVPSKIVLERYYSGKMNLGSVDIIVNIFDIIKNFVKSSLAPGVVLNYEKYVPGHGMFIVDRLGTSYLILDKFKEKIIYQVFPYLESLVSNGIISGDISAFLESIVAMINTGIEGLNYIDNIQKVMVRSGNVVTPYSLDDTVNYYKTAIIPNRCIDHKGILESVIDAVILNGAIPYDILLPGLLMNIEVACVQSKSVPLTYASYLVKKQEADDYYYDTPVNGRRVAHAYYSSKAVRNGRWKKENDTAAYKISYVDGSPPDTFLYLNGIRSHVFNAGVIASENNAAELFGSTYRLISYYLSIYEQNISFIMGCDQSYADLDSLLLLEIKYLSALNDGLRQYSGDKAKTEFYGGKILQFRTLWTEKGKYVEVDEVKFHDLVSGGVAFSIDSYEDMYNITSGIIKSIEIRGVIKMTDLKDYQKIMENIGVRQMIFQGPPGTSKTFESKRFVLQQINPSSSVFTATFVTQEDISDELAPYKLTEEDYSNPQASSKLATGGWDLVQFHPSYSYEDFIRGIEVKTAGGMPTYNSVNRILGKIAEFAKIAEQSASSSKFYLIIDEINRANVATVFGELIYGLEYRDSKISTPYEVDDKVSAIKGAKTKDIILGKNLFIIGTMNTADKSIDAIDYAIRRRFIFIDSPADRNVVINCYQNVSGNLDENSIELLLFDAVQKLFDNGAYFNEEYQKSDVRIGHTYFLRTRQFGYEEDSLEHFVFQVVPILREYVKDGILDSIDDLIAKEHEVNHISGTIDREEQIGFLSDNIMAYVKEFGSINKNGKVINNEYIGEFIENIRIAFGY